jgi:hypothetical protein
MVTASVASNQRHAWVPTAGLNTANACDDLARNLAITDPLLVKWPARREGGATLPAVRRWRRNQRTSWVASGGRPDRHEARVPNRVACSGAPVETWP